MSQGSLTSETLPPKALLDEINAALTNPCG
jgi:hypothetical protein